MRRATPTGARNLLLRRGLRQEEGIALILSLIVMGVLTITTAAVVTATTSNEHAFGRDRQANRALNIAEAGLNAGVAQLKGLPATTTSLPDAGGSLDGGTWSLHRFEGAGRNQPGSLRLDSDVDGNLARRQGSADHQHEGEADDHAPLDDDHGHDTGVARVRVRILPRRSLLGLHHDRRRELVFGQRRCEGERLRERVALHGGQRGHPPARRNHRDPQSLRRQEVQVPGQPADGRHVGREDRDLPRSSEAASGTAPPSRAARPRTRTSMPTPTPRRRPTPRNLRSTPPGTRTRGRARPPGATTTRRIRRTCPRTRAA